MALRADVTDRVQLRSACARYAPMDTFDMLVSMHVVESMMRIGKPAVQGWHACNFRCEQGLVLPGFHAKVGLNDQTVFHV